VLKFISSLFWEGIGKKTKLQGIFYTQDHNAQEENDFYNKGFSFILDQ